VSATVPVKVELLPIIPEPPQKPAVVETKPSRSPGFSLSSNLPKSTPTSEPAPTPDITPVVHEAVVGLADSLDTVRRVLQRAAKTLPADPAGSADRVSLCLKDLDRDVEIVRMVSLLEDKQGELSRFDLSQLCRNVCRLAQGPLARRSVELESGVSTEGLMVNTDAVTLARVLIGVLNSLAALMESGGKVHVGLDESRPAIEIKALAESGKGIDQTPARFLAGQAALASACRATLTVRCDKGRLTVTVALGAEVLRSAFQGRVLVIGDDMLLCHDLQGRFDGSGYEVVGATSLKFVRRLIADPGFDVALIDIYRQPREALSLIDELRQANPDVVIVATTVRGDKEGLESAITAGADECVLRPVDDLLLMKAVRRGERRMKAVVHQSVRGCLTPGEEYPTVSPRSKVPAPVAAVSVPKPAEKPPEKPAPAESAGSLRSEILKDVRTRLQHEINNPLAGIIGHAELLIEDLGKERTGQGSCEEIVVMPLECGSD
jgi:DNA-binding NarL/FixJ family response regulator